MFFVLFSVWVGVGRVLRTIKLWKNKDLRRKSKRIVNKRDVEGINKDKIVSQIPISNECLKDSIE